MLTVDYVLQRTCVVHVLTLSTVTEIIELKQVTTAKNSLLTLMHVALKTFQHGNSY